MVGGILGAAAGWIVSMLLSFFAVGEYNDNQKKTAIKQHESDLKAERERQELLEAIKQVQQIRN